MKAVLVTGAAGGIGRALCREFTAAGFAVIAADRDEADVPCHRFVPFDVRDLCGGEDARAQIAGRVRAALEGRPLSALVNNAAVQILGAVEQVGTDDWRETLETNVVAPFHLAQALLSDLEAAVGSVVNIASIHAVATKPGFVCYATSKAALVGLTRAMAVDLGPRIRVNALLPAAVDTPMLRESFSGSETALGELGRMHPAGRIARPEEVARAAVFLASDQASFMTGAAVHVDGGIAGRLHDPS
jgi:NAD(P)-dependent dehydrogenase (short-subunit alcohol dehydrogenase family)